MTIGFGNAELISDLDKSSCSGILEVQGACQGLRMEKMESTGNGPTAQSKY